MRSFASANWNGLAGSKWSQIYRTGGMLWPAHSGCSGDQPGLGRTEQHAGSDSLDQMANWVASMNDPLHKGVATFVERYKF